MIQTKVAFINLRMGTEWLLTSTIFENRIDKRKIVYYTQKVCKANRTSKPFYSAKNCKKAFYNKEKTT